MKPFVEQRMFTMTEQIAVIQPNDSDNGVVLSVQEISSPIKDARLYLSPEEAIELSVMLKSMVDKLKNNSI
jgi:hypothetical protein